MKRFKIVKKRPLVDQVLRQLREQIAAGKFGVGQRLPSEPHLMQEFGVGRTTIREAIRVLSHAGQVEVRQGSGTYVRAVSESGNLAERLRSAHVREVYQVRRALEVEVARTAAVSRDQADLALLGAIIERLKTHLRKGERGAFLETDMELYAALAACTKNTVLMDVYRSFAQVLKHAISQVMVFPGVMKSCLARHERVYQAILDGDAETAASVTAQFLERVNSLIEDLLGEDSRIGDPADHIQRHHESTEPVHPRNR
jgi:DNA-binding FadR family transcriptional regulator